jgi:hypothetical protein
MRSHIAVAHLFFRYPRVSRTSLLDNFERCLRYRLIILWCSRCQSCERVGQSLSSMRLTVLFQVVWLVHAIYSRRALWYVRGQHKSPAKANKSCCISSLSSFASWVSSNTSPVFGMAARAFQYMSLCPIAGCRVWRVLVLRFIV